ncbi:MAG: alginate export family protein [Rhodospirillaceae bacterium]|nr:alginate export family protein [Rhodospirillaceae bacterium]
MRWHGVKVLAFALGVSTAADAQTAMEALKGGKVSGDFRYRLESVDQAGFARNALASTLRSRVGYETGAFNGFKALIEFEDIRPIGDDRFNSTTNGKLTLPTVADPKITELNRAHIGYTAEKFNATVGRQRFNFDNQRFVGGVGFRQNEQTYDAARVNLTPTKEAAFTYAYVWRVNRVFGRDNPLGRFKGDTHILNGSYTFPIGKLSAYGYLLETKPSNVNSSNTFGLRFAGNRKINDGFTAQYALEFADQSDAKANAIDYSLNYYLAEGGGSFGAASARVGYEVLEGDGRIGFATPLATLHAFQGFADVFLTTPTAGIEDLYAVADYTFKFESGLKSLRLAAWVHDYSREFGAGSLGDEINLVATAIFTDNVSAELKFADYNGVPGFASRQKFWAAVTLTF